VRDEDRSFTVDRVPNLHRLFRKENDMQRYGETSWNTFAKTDNGDYVLYSEAMEEIASERAILIKQLQYAGEEIDKRDKEIAALCDKVNHQNMTIADLEASRRKLSTKLSHLTAMIEDDEVAEKAVSMNGQYCRAFPSDRRDAIDDYRAMLLDAVKEKNHG
jgi:chromosome segregation ATPase